ncbi:UNVERIFIED_CONTAM: hypothetical protein FKN15_052923 [Acipenser sinensis]
MRYWLQQLQQKRWEFCNARGAARDSWNSPTLPDLPTGLVAKDTDVFSYEKPSDSTESVRNEFAMEIAPEGLVGVNAARNPAAQPSTINFSLKQWGTGLRNSMSHLRAGRGSSENRRSVFYTSSEEWEMIDPTLKDFQDLATQEYTRKSQLEANRVSLGSAFTFDFSRNSSRPKRPFLRDMIGPSKNRSSNEASPVEWSVSNGNKPSESQLKIQSLQEELTRLKEEHTSQKVRWG